MANRTWSAVLTPEVNPVLEDVRMELCQASLVFGDADVTVYGQYLDEDVDLDDGVLNEDDSEDEVDVKGSDDDDDEDDEEVKEPKPAPKKKEKKIVKKGGDAESSSDEEEMNEDDDEGDDNLMQGDNEPFVICRLNKYAPSCTLALDLEGSFQFMIKVNKPNSSGMNPKVALVGTFDIIDEDEDDDIDLSDEEFEPGVISENMADRVTEVTSEDDEETAPESTKTGGADTPPVQETKKGKKAQNKRPAAERSETATKKAKEESTTGGKSAVVRKELPEGVKYEVLSTGSGKQAAPGKKAKVRYEGRLASNGRKFDSGTLDFVIGSGDMIKGFDVGVRGMLQKEQRRIFVPSRLAYGRQSVGDIPPHSDLIFDITLLGVH